MIRNFKQLFLGISLLFSSINLVAQVPNLSSLSIEQIMQGEKFVGVSPSDVFWSEDGKTTYFKWNPENLAYKELYKITKEKPIPQKVSIEEQLALPGRNGSYNANRTQKVYSKAGDIFLYDLETKETRQVTNTINREYQPSFSDDGQYIYFRALSNMYSWNTKTGSLVQLSNFKKGNAKSEKKVPDAEQWLEDDQLGMMEVLQERTTTRKTTETYTKQFKPKRPKSIFIKDWNMDDLCISPNGEYIVYRLVKRKAKGTKVPDYVINNGFTNNRNARAKVGHSDNQYKVGIYNTIQDSFYTVSMEGISGIYDKPSFLKDYHKKKDGKYKATYTEAREVLLHRPKFSKNSEAVSIVRALDCKDRWVVKLDLNTGKLKTLNRQRDEAWIGGPGISMWTGWAGISGWLENDKDYWFLSEESGYAHLYIVNTKTGKKTALTPKGNWEVTTAQPSKDGKHFYITTSEVDPGERHFYKIPIAGGLVQKITSLEGNHKVSLSPDEKELAVLYSSSNTPWELYTMPNKPKAEALKITDSRSDQFKAYQWRTPELVYFEAKDGKKVRARLYEPHKKKKNRAAVIFVHGAGYLQNVHKWWSLYYREYMFHNILADNGYTVLDIDYRASEGYGRDWRTAIYRHMGGKDLSDQVDGAQFLVENYKIDAKRVGIYGGSYGGFITLMAMFTSPETFKCGAALRSVTDWAHYNHSYTSCILNTPVEDSIAYKRSSPIYFAEGLKGKLLMLHGMTDTNVQFQDVVRLSQRLIELGKDDWELAVFPMEGHGFVEPSSWADEYKRIFKLFQENLRKRK
ncbi:MAG: prolyl oligopeptidase family serine peptidase [Aureispira sp.]|nr:prolyl oligopeptidase family serine peptidase [Aureispira sp.]